MTEPNPNLTVTINGERRALRGPLTVAALLRQLGIDTAQVAVERNRALLGKSRFADTTLADGDALEIVTLVGGG